MDEIIDKIENANIAIDEYTEGGVLCGYELDMQTIGGLNQIVFIDFRGTDKNPKDKNDFKELFLERINSIDIDEEIDLNRQNPLYKASFTIRESLEDIENWYNNLLTLAKSL